MSTIPMDRDEPQDERNRLSTSDLLQDRGAETGLLPRDEAEDYQERWTQIQAAFVDDPREATANADALVAEVIQRLTESFAEERDGLEKQWTQGAEVSTEDLRVALQRYRSFFERLLGTEVLSK